MKCNKCGHEIPGDSLFCPDCGTPTKETPTDSATKRPFTMSLKSILVVIALGIWMLVLQNLGVIPVTQDVKVKNMVDVSGRVDIGSSVDVNLQYINGRSDVFFNNPRRGDKDKYYVIPVTVE